MSSLSMNNRRRTVSVPLQVNFGGLFRDLSRRVLGRELGDKIYDVGAQIYRESTVPHQPFDKQDDLICPGCVLPIYLSANHIFVCLKCQQTFGFSVEASVQAASGLRGDNPRIKVQHVDRSYKVKVGGRSGRSRSRHAMPPPPPPPAPPDPITELRAAYHTLSLAHTVTEEAVRRRRKEMAQKHHSDLGGSDHKMAEINAAADLIIANIRLGIRP